MRQPVFLARNFQPALGGPFFTLFRHKTNRVRTVTQGNRLHLIGRRHLKVQRHRQRLHQPLDIGIRDMAAILAQMRGYAVGARVLGQLRGANRIGIGAAARVSHRRHMVDVDAKP